MAILERAVQALEAETSNLQPRRWTRDEYHHMHEAGIFLADERLELLDGEIWKRMSPQSREHFRTLHRNANACRVVFGTEHVQEQGPIGVDMYNEPEPDVTVLAATIDDYQDHPTPAAVVLLIEVSDSSLSIDRNKKASIYAKAGIADYWILNMKKRQLEVRRDPMHDPNSKKYVYRYQTTITLSETDTVTPLAAPQSVLRVADLFLPQPEDAQAQTSPSDMP